MQSLSERAIPATLIPTKPKAILPGITQEQIQVINQNTIAQPTPAGTEIQIFLPQLANTFLDTQSSYFVVHATASFTSTDDDSIIFNNESNGAIIGSFYSVFYRMTVYANSVNVTDDIYEMGLTAVHLLRLTMTRTARLSMAHILGFQNNVRNISALAGARIFGPFPNYGRLDSYSFASNVNNATVGLPLGFSLGWDGTTPGNPQYQAGYPLGNNQTKVMDFDFAIPVIGSLGVTNDNPYYMGLGNTRISLYTEDPKRFLLLPPAFTRVASCINNTGTAATGLTGCGGLKYNNDFAITRIRFEANIIRLDNLVWGQLMPLIMAANGNRLVSKVTSFTTSVQTIAQGAIGLQQPQMQIRRGSVKSVIITFNPVGGSNNTSYTTVDGTATTANIEIQNYFNKWGSLNPGLGANTLFLVNNVNYPKLGLDPSNYPSETFAYILDSINMLISSNMKPSLTMTNWLVADPNLITQTTTSALSSMWRSGAILQYPQQKAATAGGVSFYFTSSIWWLWTFLSQAETSSAYTLGDNDEILSNDFFLYFTFEDQPRPGMISGKSTMDGSNYLNAPLISPTSYAYNVYFIAAFDALCVHELDTQNVYYIS